MELYGDIDVVHAGVLAVDDVLEHDGEDVIGWGAKERGVAGNVLADSPVDALEDGLGGGGVEELGTVGPDDSGPVILLADTGSEEGLHDDGGDEVGEAAEEAEDGGARGGDGTALEEEGQRSHFACGLRSDEKKIDLKPQKSKKKKGNETYFIYYCILSSFSQRCDK